MTKANTGDSPDALLGHIAERLRFMLDLPATRRDEVKAALLATETELSVRFGLRVPAPATTGAVSIPDAEEIVRLAHGVTRNCLSRTCFIRDSHREACHGCDDFQVAVKAVAQRLCPIPDAIVEIERWATKETNRDV
jgi:hypothetical protein